MARRLRHRMVDELQRPARAHGAAAVVKRLGLKVGPGQRDGLDAAVIGPVAA